MESIDIEKAQARLNDISVKMNEQGLPLEETLRLYGEAVTLIRGCKEEIARAELEVQKLEKKTDLKVIR